MPVPRRSLIIPAFLIAATAGCERGPPPSEADDAAVYRALLRDECCIERAIVQDVTEDVGHDDSVLDSGFSREIRDAVADLVRRGGTARPLPDSLAVWSDDRRISADSIRALQEWMARTRARSLTDSSSIVLLSRVGYSRNGGVAVVWITEICGYLCGGSTLRALRRHPAGWIPAERVVIIFI